MNKSELIASIAEKADMSKALAGLALNAFIDTVKECAKNDEKVSIAHFGEFSVKESAAREGRNPRTGETIKIEAKKNLKFKASKTILG